MEIEFYPTNESEFKQECVKSKKLYWIIYKDDRIFYHYQTTTQGNFNSPLKSYLRTCAKDGVKITNISGITKLRAFASNEFLQEKGKTLEKILFSKNFYFDKAEVLWKKFLSADISKEEMEGIRNQISESFTKDGGKYIGLLDYYKRKDEKPYEFLELIGKLIAIFDKNAANKKELNPYEDKRTVANSGVRQQDWIKNLLKYKQGDNASPSVNSAIKYINDPVKNTSILNEEHKEKISISLLKKNYNSGTFLADIVGFLKKEGINLKVKNKKNLTFFMSSVLYENFRDQWGGKSVGISTKEEVMKEIKLLEYKKQIILQGSPGTGKTRLAKEIAYCLITGDTLSDDENERQEQLNILMQSNQKSINKTNAIFEEYLKIFLVISTINERSLFTIIKITPKHIKIKLSSGNSRSIAKNKILDRLKEENWKPNGGVSSYEVGIAKYIFDAQSKVNLSPNSKGTEMTTPKNLITNLESNKIAIPENMPLNLEQYKLIQFHPAYTYEDFVRGIVAETDDNGNISYEVKNKILVEMAENAISDSDSSFVLIIDEINRANLSSVLGELIYALEYRGKAVESMYEYEGSREITLPENLYIIGTMNTADRSVGHIDYAIRRRFAFVDVNTDESVILGRANKLLFEKVKALFDNLSDEFDKNDVMIGHSYFLKKDLALALEYEIKPILQEYRKDGVLTCRQKDIEDLEC